MTNVVARRWTVRAVAVAGDPLKVSCDDRPFDLIAAASESAAISPVEYLLISIASCFALSCRMALAERHVVADSLAVTVRGAKASDAPSRLASIDIELELPGSIAADSERIAGRAKELCTVTNTLAEGLEPEVRVRLP